MDDYVYVGLECYGTSSKDYILQMETPRKTFV